MCQRENAINENDNHRLREETAVCLDVSPFRLLVCYPRCGSNLCFQNIDTTWSFLRMSVDNLVYFKTCSPVSKLMSRTISEHNFTSTEKYLKCNLVSRSLYFTTRSHFLYFSIRASFHNKQ
jgi:hypothetical protein